jgi:hypothetical protein
MKRWVAELRPRVDVPTRTNRRRARGALGDGRVVHDQRPRAASSTSTPTRSMRRRWRACGITGLPVVRRRRRVARKRTRAGVAVLALCSARPFMPACRHAKHVPARHARVRRFPRANVRRRRPRPVVDRRRLRDADVEAGPAVARTTAARRLWRPKLESALVALGLPSSGVGLGPGLVLFLTLCRT